MSEMRSTRQDLHSLAARVLKDSQPEEAVVLAWPLVCGSAVAQRTEAISFDNGALLVRVPDRSWQSQLDAFSREYCYRLSKVAGLPVNSICYQIAPPERQS